MLSPAVLAPILSRVCVSHCWVRKPGEHPGHRDFAIDDSVIEGHLASRYSVGACPITPGESTTRIAVLDLDSHKGEVPWSSMREVASHLIEALAENHQQAIAFRSGGGAGIHIYVLYDTPQDAYSVREEMRMALAKAGLREGSKGGIAAGVVEIFPKQDSVPIDGAGSMFILPLSMKSCALMDSTLEDTVPGNIQWRSSDNVTRRERPIVADRTTAHVSTEHATLQQALAAINNDGANHLDYDEWRNIIFAIHSATEGSDAGLALAHAFSARAANYDADFLDNRVWPYITERDGGVTVQSIFNMASANGWLDPAIQDAFPVMPPDSTRVESASDAFQVDASGIGASPQSTGGTRFTPLLPSEFTEGPDPTWYIKHVIPEAALGVVFGPPGCGKTFFALDVLCAIARGGEWRGKTIKQGRGVYICAEGAGGFRKRLRAYLKHNEIARPDDLDIRIIPDAPNFTEADDIRDIIRQVKRCGPVSMVVVDTLARVMVGADENSAQDMGKVAYHCAQLHRVTGAMVILVHHSGKDASRGARGSNALLGACDVEIEITRDNNDRAAIVSKLKEDDDGTAYNFRLKVMDLYPDDEMEMVTSCVIDHSGDPVQAGTKLRKPQAKQQQVIEIARSVIDGFQPCTVARVEQLAILDIKGKLAEGVRDTSRTDVPKIIKSLFDSGWFIRSEDGLTFTVAGHVSIA